VVYPLSLVITRLQVQKQTENSRRDGSDEAKEPTKITYDGIYDAFRKIYQREGGLGAFYAGCIQDTSKTIADSFLFFLAYSYLRNYRQRKSQSAKQLPMVEELLVGMIAGAFAKFFTTPIAQIVTRKQTATMVTAQPSNTPSSSRELSSKDIALQIIEEKGIAGFWSGYSATLVLTLNPAITMLLHEAMLRAVVSRKNRDTPRVSTTFLIAAISKAIASTVTYPFSLAKTRTQFSAQGPEDEEEKDIEVTEKEDKAKEGAAKAARKGRQKTVFATICKIAKSEGFLALYRGLEGEVLKGFLQHGITMLMKEQIHKGVIQLYYLVLRALRRYPTPEELANMAKARSQAIALDAKDSLENTVKKGKEVITEVVAKGNDTASDLVTTSQETWNKAQEEFDLNKWMQGARDILWGIVDEDDE
jgi:hypothetical protein